MAPKKYILIIYSPIWKYMTVCSCHVTYAFWIESTLLSYLNVKELLARSRLEIWSLSDCNWTRTQNHLVRKRTLNYLAKWLSVRLQTKWFWVPVQLQLLENAWFYERLFLKLVMIMVKKCSVKDTLSVKISFIHYLKKIRAMLPVAFEEFGLIYMFKLLFSF